MSYCEITTNPIFVALHHKCGNNYFTKVLRQFVNEAYSPEYDFMIVRQVEFNSNMSARFVANTITRLRNFTLDQVRQLPPNSIVIACKRDPRSLIVSCTDYHLRGSEAWTRVSNKRYGGKSYSNYLRDAATDEERLIISMENVAGNIIRRMASFIDASDILTVKLEDIARDDSCQTYHDICKYMQLSDHNYHILSNLLRKNSLWYIRKKTGTIPQHCTSGVSRDSINRLQGMALARYHDLFGDIHLRLGYKE